MASQLILSSPVFTEGALLPRYCTGFGGDHSPELHISGLDDDNIQMLALIMDDLDVPMTKSFNHWLLWNIPRVEIIPANIPAGVQIPSLPGAVQGRAWSGHAYAGPKPPFFLRKPHRYRFSLYGLNCRLDLSANSRRGELLRAMSEYIVQSSSLTGIFGRDLASSRQQPARTSFYIRVYPEGAGWICEEGDIYSDGSEKVKSRCYYQTEEEAEQARIMQLH